VPCTHRGARAGAALNSLTTPPMQVGVLALEAHSLPGPASTVAGAHRALQWVAKHRCRDALPAPHLPARPPAGSGARLQRLLRHTHAKQNYYVSLIRMSGGDHPHSEPRQPTPQITRSSSCCESMRARDKSYKQTGLHLLIEAQQLDPKWYGQSPTAARLPAGRTCPKLTCRTAPAGRKHHAVHRSRRAGACLVWQPYHAAARARRQTSQRQVAVSLRQHRRAMLNH